ncbi:ATP-binding protein, partial [Streptomyces purpurogeneiscleroticus]|uniref:ATP-binding protein n=1 Tax=Streptomyces purpurogeneiscleroticus TaxID=68259 RepID=UPI001CBF1F11
MKAERRVGNLPDETSRLVGRRAELEEVARLCGRSRLVTVTGVGGVGKTRLAQRAATELQPGFTDGAWWVELSPLRDGSALPYAIAEVLPLADQTTRPMIEVVAEYLAVRQLLLVWDTCEHLLQDCREMAATLLTVAPGLRILTTSRRPLGLHLEEMLSLDPLPLPKTDADEAADAVVLLADRATQTVPGFAITDANRTELAALCRRLEGLPLALELAAARLREMPPAELNKRLDDRYAILGNTDGEDSDATPPWHQALRTAIGWSHELCTPAERLAWARLSVFAGTIGTAAARQVLADEHLPAHQVPHLLTALVEKSILTWVPTGAEERYRMLDTLREYGAHWLRSLGEERAVRHRHLTHYLHLAHQAEDAWMGPDQITWYERMVAEHANLRAAFDHCLAEEDPPAALELGGTLWFFWHACGFGKDGQHYLQRALAPETAPGPVRAKALWACGMAAYGQGDTETSLRYADAFRRAVATEADETAPVAAAFLTAASLALSGRPAPAVEMLDATLHTRPTAGRYDAAWILAWMTRAYAFVHLGRFAEAAATAAAGRDECAGRGETWVRTYGDYICALAAQGRERPEEAAAHARSAIAGKHRLHDSTGIAITVDLLASATIASGHAEHGARILGLADQIWQTVGTPQLGSPELIAARTACEKTARRLIGDDAYQTAFHTGCTI